MTPWKAYALTAMLTASAMTALVGLRYAGTPVAADGGAVPVVADPVTTGSIARRPASEAGARPRRFAQSAFAAGEITVPVPKVETTAFAFRRDAAAEPGGPVAGAFTGSVEDAAAAGEAPPRRAGTRVAGLGGAPPAEPAGAAPKMRETVMARVDVLDGRSFAADGRRVRLAGIDLPGAGRACPMLDGTAADCRERARTQLELFLRHRPVSCALPADRAKGPAETRCRVGNADIGEWLARSGWALAGPGADERILRAVAEARRRRIGLWRQAG